MDDKECTPEVIAAALKQAAASLKTHPDWDVLRALAEATTTAQCGGVQGFKVFRDVRKALDAVLPDKTTLLHFCQTATPAMAQTVLEQARLVVMS